MTVEKSIVIAVLSYDNFTMAGLSSTLPKCFNPLPHRALPRNNTLSTFYYRFFISFLNSMLNIVQVVATATASATGSARNTAKTLSEKK